jgi:soluble lytic murein transglycosylase-like protein
MQVMPFWVKLIGVPGQDLFAERTNLRYGCTILRHYIDREHGNLVYALGRYNGTLGQPGYPRRVMNAWKARWAL